MEENFIKAWEKTTKDMESLDNTLLRDIWLELKHYFDNNYSEEQIYNTIINNYQNIINEILKLTPGLSTGLFDINDDILINTYDGVISDINDDKIDRNTVFDAASTTKLFTALLLLKEEERGNINLDNKYSDYSKFLKNIEIPIIEALRFNLELRTDGRIDEKNIGIEEIKRRFNRTYIYRRNCFIYSDVPYMLVPLLFGNTKEEATENYLRIFYETYRKLNLLQTGYSTINMTGGIIVNNRNLIFDPKTRIMESKLGYISGHSGVTTTVEDMEKLFIGLKDGFLKKESIERLTKEKDNSNRGLAVYINKGNIAESPVHEVLSKKAFSISGSTGSYAVFDLDNGLMTCFLANIKSSTKIKSFNTGSIYTFGDNKISLPENFETKVIGGTQSIRDGRIIKGEDEITFFRATNNFKTEQIKTLIKLKFIKNYIIISNRGQNIDELFKIKRLKLTKDRK